MFCFSYSIIQQIMYSIYSTIILAILVKHILVYKGKHNQVLQTVGVFRVKRTYHYASNAPTRPTIQPKLLPSPSKGLHCTNTEEHMPGDERWTCPVCPPLYMGPLQQPSKLFRNTHLTHFLFRLDSCSIYYVCAAERVVILQHLG